MLGERVFTLDCVGRDVRRCLCGARDIERRPTITPKAYPPGPHASCQPFSAGAELSSNGLLLRRWFRSSRGVAPKKLR